MKRHRLFADSISVSASGVRIISGLTLSIRSGETHALMGPNGSGKSTLLNAIMGHPSYTLEEGTKGIYIDRTNIAELSPDERARKGLFMAFQSPVVIEGVTVLNLVRTAYQNLYPSKQKPAGRDSPHNPVLRRRFSSADMSLAEFVQKTKDICRLLAMPDSFLNRSVHDGFSGGEKKKLEMLQALLFRPRFALFDEIDTGLDVDALKAVAGAVKLLGGGGTGILIVTHYQRILRYLHPDAVHVMSRGAIVESGNAALARRIEKEGYGRYLGTAF